jgi:Flp pilus assembly protein TadD
METATRWATIAPESYEPYTARAFIRMKSGDWLEAEADCREALKRHPLHAETHLYLAICLHKRGRAAEAGQAARTASDLEADPREKAGLMDWYRRATR